MRHDVRGIDWRYQLDLESLVDVSQWLADVPLAELHSPLADLLDPIDALLFEEAVLDHLLDPMDDPLLDGAVLAARLSQLLDDRFHPCLYVPLLGSHSQDMGMLSILRRRYNKIDDRTHSYQQVSIASNTIINRNDSRYMVTPLHKLHSILAL